MSLQSFYVNVQSERAEAALALINNLDTALQKINNEISMGNREFEDARRSADSAKQIRSLYSNQHGSPAKAKYFESDPRVSMQSLELDRERVERAQTRANLEQSKQNERELKQVIQSMEEKVIQLQQRIQDAEEDAMLALDLAKANDTYCQQLEISLEQCRLEKSYLEMELNQKLAQSSFADPPPIRDNRSFHTNFPRSEHGTANSHRAMVTRGRELLQKARQTKR